MRPAAPRGVACRIAPALLCLLSGPAHATMPPREGPLPPAVAQGFASGLFSVPEHVPGLEASSGPVVWRLPIIRVAFSDSAIVHPVAALEQRLFDVSGAEPRGSMSEYYLWVSRGRLIVTGEVVATIVLPHPREWYSGSNHGVNLLGSPHNAYGLFRDALYACDAQVDFSRFDLNSDGWVDMLWVLHAGPGAETTGHPDDLWSITSRAVGGWSNATPFETNDPIAGSELARVRVDRFTIVPELSGFHPGTLNEIGVYCHEFGHTLGLPDLYDTSALGGTANVGPGNWSLMSTGAYGTDGITPDSPSHLGAWSALRLGWANRIRPTRDTTLVLAPLSDGGPVLEFWFQGEDSPEHFLIENRVRESFDRQLLEEGLIVTQVDEMIAGPGAANNKVNAGLSPGVRILEADGDYDLFRGVNRGDAFDPFPGRSERVRIDDLTTPWTRTFKGAPTNISLDHITKQGWDVSLQVLVRAPGWQEPGPLDEGAAPPLESFGPAPRAALAASGTAWQVSSEEIGGLQRAVIRERPWLEPWGPPVSFDRGIGSAVEPTIARIGKEDLAVAWIEVDQGTARLLYRARLRGAWTTPRVLTPQTGGCSSPAIAVDDRGRVYLTWLEQTPEFHALRFMQFLYATPFGQPTTITNAIDSPTAPTITAAGDGHAYVLWSDYLPNRRVAMGCRFHPDSGLSARFTVGPNSAFEQPSVSGVLDSSGVLHAVWQVNSSVGSEIHYQRRTPAGRPTPRDTTLDAIGSGLQNPRIALDRQGGLHVAYERSSLGAQQVRYKRWHPVLGWDHRATEVSGPGDLSAASIEILPTSPGNVTLTWTGYDGQGVHLRTRSRLLDGSFVAAAPPYSQPILTRLSAGPNPLRAGQALEISGPGLVPGAVVELLDASGRRAAEVRADTGGRARLGSDQTRGLAAGLYFARIQGSAATGRVVVLR